MSKNTKKASPKKAKAAVTRTDTSIAKLTSMLERSKGASVAECAKTLKTSPENVRSMIGYIRGRGEDVESLGKGVFKIG